jgi:hypothetical protein
LRQREPVTSPGLGPRPMAGRRCLHPASSPPAAASAHLSGGPATPSRGAVPDAPLGS